MNDIFHSFKMKIIKVLQGYINKAVGGESFAKKLAGIWGICKQC